MHDWIDEMKGGQRVSIWAPDRAALKAMSTPVSVVCVDSDLDAFVNPYTPHSKFARVIAAGDKPALRQRFVRSGAGHHVLAPS